MQEMSATPFIYECPLCSQKYSTSIEVSTHYKKDHSTPTTNQIEEEEGPTVPTNIALKELKQKNALMGKPKLHKLVVKLVNNWPPENTLKDHLFVNSRYNHPHKDRYFLSKRYYSSHVHDGLNVKQILDQFYETHTEITPSLISILEKQTGLSKYAIKLWFKVKDFNVECNQVESVLLNEYTYCTYPNDNRMAHMIRQTGMTAADISTWFLIRRAKTNNTEFKSDTEKALWVWFLPRASQISELDEGSLTQLASMVSLKASDIMQIFKYWVQYLSELHSFIEGKSSEFTNEVDQFRQSGINFNTMVIKTLGKFRDKQKSFGIPVPGERKLKFKSKQRQQSRSKSPPPRITPSKQQKSNEQQLEDFTTYEEDREKRGKLPSAAFVDLSNDVINLDDIDSLGSSFEDESFFINTRHLDGIRLTANAGEILKARNTDEEETNTTLRNLFSPSEEHSEDENSDISSDSEQESDESEDSDVVFVADLTPGGNHDSEDEAPVEVKKKPLSLAVFNERMLRKTRVTPVEIDNGEPELMETSSTYKAEIQPTIDQGAPVIDITKLFKSQTTNTADNKSLFSNPSKKTQQCLKASSSTPFVDLTPLIEEVKQEASMDFPHDSLAEEKAPNFALEVFSSVEDYVEEEDYELVIDEEIPIESGKNKDLKITPEGRKASSHNPATTQKILQKKTKVIPLSKHKPNRRHSPLHQLRVLSIADISPPAGTRVTKVKPRKTTKHSLAEKIKILNKKVKS